MRLFRGISRTDFINQYGLVKIDVFPFSDNHRDASGYNRESINWEDDECALTEILYRSSNPYEYDFIAGVGVIDHDELNARLRPYVVSGVLRVDHDPDEEKPGNNYHGNIGIIATAEKEIKRSIRYQLAGFIGYNVLTRDGKQNDIL